MATLNITVNVPDAAVDDLFAAWRAHGDFPTWAEENSVDPAAPTAAQMRAYITSEFRRYNRNLVHGYRSRVATAGVQEVSIT